VTYEYQGNRMAGGGYTAEATSARTRRERTGERSLAQILAAVFGATFLLVGIAGFIPGITSNYDELSFLGVDSDAELLGLFRVSVFHNIVHLLFGVGLLAAARATWARLYLIGGGIAYLLVSAYGLIVEETSDANFIPVNDADNILHIVLTAGLLAAGVAAIAAERRSASDV
jgi:hypothetical protein